MLNIISNCINNSLIETHTKEILRTNHNSQKYGLTLTEDNVKEIIEHRNNVLKDQGKIEMDIKTTKNLIKSIYTSPFTDKDCYLETINKIQDIFYDLKYKSKNKVSDIELIEKLDKFYKKSSGDLDTIKIMSEEFLRKLNKPRVN